jgi:hypothetical protein
LQRHNDLNYIYPCIPAAGNAAGNGQLADGGFAVFLAESELVPGGALDLFASGTYMIAIKKATNAATAVPEFKGHYVRLGRGTSGVETPEAFSLLDGGSKIVEPCVLEGIAAFTHTDNSLKTSAAAALTFPDSSNQVNAVGDVTLPLDVTIVVTNCDPNESPLVANVEPCDPTNSTYYYSQYIINLVAAPWTTSNSFYSAVWMVCWIMIIVAVVQLSGFSL